MQARQLRAARGWAWMVEGFRLFWRNPALITFLVVSYWFLLAVINVFPLVGQIAASLAMPALSVGVANGCRAVDRGERGAFELILSGFRLNLPSLLRLGAVYLIATLAVLAATIPIDAGQLWRLVIKGQKLSIETLREVNPFALQVAIALFLPVMMAYWFAPLLAAWAELSAAKSLFFSFFACLRNWRAFLVYGIGIMLFSAVLPGVLLGAVASVSESAINVLSVAVFTVLVFVFVPILFASFYVSACDIFVDLCPGDRRPARTY